MQLTQQNLRRQIADICQYITLHCITPSGLISYYSNVDTHECPPKIIGGDIGDVVPFLYWSGEYLQDNQLKDWACHQMDLYIQLLQRPSGIFASSVKSTPFHPDVVDYRDISDLIVGLDLMYMLTGLERYLDSISAFYSHLERDRLIAGRGLPNFLYVPALHVALPLSFGQAAGIFIEEAVQMAAYSDDSRYIQLARHLAQPWIACRQFESTGLFPFLLPKRAWKPLLGFLMKLRTGLTLDLAVTFKQNTNLCFGLIGLFDATHDQTIGNALVKWCDSVTDLLRDDKGLFYGIYSFTTRARQHLTLNYNNAIMDVFLDLAIRCGTGRFVEAAERCALAWLENRTPEGLIPQGIQGQFRAFAENKVMPSSVIWLDSQVDFAIVLMKLCELTGTKSLRAAVDQILAAIIAAFRYADTYVDMVDSPAAKPYRKVIEVKFLSLYLKLLLAYANVADGDTLTQDNKLLLLVRDR